MKLEYVNLFYSENLARIGKYAFAYNDNLIRVITPNDEVGNTNFKLSIIDDYAFYDDFDLVEFNLYEGLTTVGQGAFETYDYNEYGNKVTDRNYVLTEDETFDETKTYYVLDESSRFVQETVTAGDPVTPDTYYELVLTERVVQTRGSLLNVNLPTTLKNIGNYAFAYQGCQNITINNDILGNYMFYENDSLVNLTVPSQVITIGEYVFAENDLLANLTLASGLTILGDHMFENDDSLTEITVPASVETLGTHIFAEASGMRLLTC